MFIRFIFYLYKIYNKKKETIMKISQKNVKEICKALEIHISNLAKKPCK